MTTGTAGQRARLAVTVAGVFAASAAAMVPALRLANVGLEPQGRDWWLVVEIGLGLCFVPIGCALLFRTRVALGIAFVFVGASQLVSAIVSEWHAWNGSSDPTPLFAAGRLVEFAGLVVLAAVVPFLLPWPRQGIAEDRLTLWLALGVVAAAVGRGRGWYRRRR